MTTSNWHSVTLLILAVKDTLRQHPHGLLPLAIRGLLEKPPLPDVLAQVLDLLVHFGEIQRTADGRLYIAETSTGSASAPKPKTKLHRMLYLLAEKPMTYVELAAALGVSRETASAMLTSGVTRGIVKSVGSRGRASLFAAADKVGNAA